MTGVTKKLFFVIFAAAVATSGSTPLVGHFPNEQRGPAVSVPQETMTDNGDRVSPYPPYYHNDPTGHGGGHRR